MIEVDPNELDLSELEKEELFKNFVSDLNEQAERQKQMHEEAHFNLMKQIL